MPDASMAMPVTNTTLQHFNKINNSRVPDVPVHSSKTVSFFDKKSTNRSEKQIMSNMLSNMYPHQDIMPSQVDRHGTLILNNLSPSDKELFNEIQRKTTLVFVLSTDTDDLISWKWDMSQWDSVSYVPMKDLIDSPLTFAQQELLHISKDPIFPHSCSQTDLNATQTVPTYPLHKMSVKNFHLMSNSIIIGQESVYALWKQKSLLDEMFDADKGTIYRIAREAIFPPDRYRELVHLTRTGYKLKEITDNVPILESLLKNTNSQTPFIVLDILGCKNVWSDFLYSEIKYQQSQQNDIVKKPDSYLNTKCSTPTSLLPGLFLIYGIPPAFPMITGHEDRARHQTIKKQRPYTAAIPNIHLSENIIEPHTIETVLFFLQQEQQHLKTNASHIKPMPSLSSETDRLVSLVVADGSLKIGKDKDTGEHLENYQELFNSRCLLSEIVLAFKVLKTGGHFVVKVFDTFSTFTISILFLLTKLFDKVTVIKPSRSRPVNSERYIVCLQLKSSNLPVVKFCKLCFDHIYYYWSNCHSPDEYCPESLVPIDILQQDQNFMTSVSKMTQSICLRQTFALRLVNEHITFLGLRSHNDGCHYKQGSGKSNGYKLNNKQIEDKKLHSATSHAIQCSFNDSQRDHVPINLSSSQTFTQAIDHQVIPLCDTHHHIDQTHLIRPSTIIQQQKGQEEQHINNHTVFNSTKISNPENDMYSFKNKHNGVHLILPTNQTAVPPPPTTSYPESTQINYNYLHNRSNFHTDFRHANRCSESSTLYKKPLQHKNHQDILPHNKDLNDLSISNTSLSHNKNPHDLIYLSGLQSNTSSTFPILPVMNATIKLNDSSNTHTIQLKNKLNQLFTSIGVSNVRIGNTVSACPLPPSTPYSNPQRIPNLNNGESQKTYCHNPMMYNHTHISVPIHHATCESIENPKKNYSNHFMNESTVTSSFMDDPQTTVSSNSLSLSQDVHQQIKNISSDYSQSLLHIQNYDPMKDIPENTSLYPHSSIPTLNSNKQTDTLFGKYETHPIAVSSSSSSSPPMRMGTAILKSLLNVKDISAASSLPTRDNYKSHIPHSNNMIITTDHNSLDSNVNQSFASVQKDSQYERGELCALPRHPIKYSNNKRNVSSEKQVNTLNHSFGSSQIEQKKRFFDKRTIIQQQFPNRYSSYLHHHSFPNVLKQNQTLSCMKKKTNNDDRANGRSAHRTRLLHYRSLRVGQSHSNKIPKQLPHSEYNKNEIFSNTIMHYSDKSKIERQPYTNNSYHKSLDCHQEQYSMSASNSSQNLSKEYKKKKPKRHLLLPQIKHYTQTDVSSHSIQHTPIHDDSLMIGPVYTQDNHLMAKNDLEYNAINTMSQKTSHVSCLNVADGSVIVNLHKSPMSKTVSSDYYPTLIATGMPVNGINS